MASLKSCKLCGGNFGDGGLWDSGMQDTCPACREFGYSHPSTDFEKAIDKAAGEIFNKLHEINNDVVEITDPMVFEITFITKFSSQRIDVTLHVKDGAGDKIFMISSAVIEEFSYKDEVYEPVFKKIEYVGSSFACKLENSK